MTINSTVDAMVELEEKYVIATLNGIIPSLILLEYKNGMLSFLGRLNNLPKMYPYPKPAVSKTTTNMPNIKIRLDSPDITFDTMWAIAITIMIKLTNDEIKVIVFLVGTYLSSSTLKNSAMAAGANMEKKRSLNMDTARSGDAIPIK